MKKNRILVIDDDATATRMVRMTLERTGRYEVGELNDPGQAISIARVFQPDLILLDVCMPDVEGSEVAGKISVDPVLADTPIVFLTCIVTPSEAGKTGSLIIGRHEYIAKPARPEKLIACIEANLERAHRSSPNAQYVTRS
jgi:DNA-binding response OmpR family regulator